MRPQTAIDTRALFPPLHTELITLLRGLTAEDWGRHTSAGRWSIRDVAAHLLDTCLRRISVNRDHHVLAAPGPLENYHELLRYLNQLNAEWITATRRISPRLLTEMLDIAGTTQNALMESAPLDGEAPWAVAWAGQRQSPMWLDIGREYTERWHHQDQIREAVGAAPLVAQAMLRPVIEISLYAIAPALERIDRPEGTVIELHATGAAGSAWQFERSGGSWQLRSHAEARPAATVAVTDLTLARLLMHRLEPGQAERLAIVAGDRELAEALLGARAVMV